MAIIKPFRAYRYNQNPVDINKVILSNNDNLSALEIQHLYDTPYQSIRILQPLDISLVKSEIEDWKANEIIQQDFLPAIYVYYQYYKLPQSEELLCRKGFICKVKIQDWEDRVILRHEKTIEESLQERLEVLKNVELNINPVHGLYSETESILEKFMDESMKAPVYKVEDTEGTINVLSMIHDAKVIRLFAEELKEKKIILADGHHRYKASLAYQKKYPENKSAQYILMYLTNTEKNNITTFPTHRLIGGLKNFDLKNYIKILEKYFHITKMENNSNIQNDINKKDYAFGLLTENQNYILELKEEFYPDSHQSHMHILHQYIIDKVCAGLENNPQIKFSGSYDKCLQLIGNKIAQLAIITNGIKLEEIKKICYSGDTFPAKSTYFYPKVMTGLIFSSISEKDEINNVNSCLNF